MEEASGMRLREDHGVMDEASGGGIMEEASGGGIIGESWKRHLEEISRMRPLRHLEEASWRMHHRGGIIKKTSWTRHPWRRYHGGGIMEDALWRKRHGGGIVEEKRVRAHTGAHGHMRGRACVCVGIWA